MMNNNNQPEGSNSMIGRWIATINRENPRTTKARGAAVGVFVGLGVVALAILPDDAKTKKLSTDHTAEDKREADKASSSREMITATCGHFPTAIVQSSDVSVTHPHMATCRASALCSREGVRLERYRTEPWQAARCAVADGHRGASENLSAWRNQRNHQARTAGMRPSGTVTTPKSPLAIGQKIGTNWPELKEERRLTC